MPAPDRRTSRDLPAQHLATEPKPRLRGFAIPGNASSAARKAHELKRLGESPDVFEWSRRDAKVMSQRAAKLRTERARWAREQRVLRVRLRWRLRQLGLADQ